MMNLAVNINKKELKHIPKEGPFIILVNRFSYLYEEEAIIEILNKIRPDIKVLTFHRKTKELENTIYIKDYNNRWSKVREYCIKEIRKATKEEIPLAIFPGKRISNLNFKKFGWDKEILKTVYLSKIPVIPMYCNWGEKIDSPLGFALPEIYFDKTINKELKVRIGKAIIPDQIDFIDNLESYRKYIFAKTFSIGKNIILENFFKGSKETSNQLMDSVAKELIKKDIDSLPKEALLCEKGNLKTYIANSFQLPNALTQIGILREQTFRNGNEGTGKCLDIDEFDVFYYQIIIWDDQNNKIIAGCRLAFADWVVQNYGKKGLYTNTLFQFDSNLNPVLFDSIEIGKFYIINEYQKSSNALFLLWKSLQKISLKNPKYKYYIGTVNISNEYSSHSKKMIAYCLKHYYFNHKIAEFVTSRNPYVFRLSKTEKESLLDFSNSNNIQMFEKLLEEIEPNYFKHFELASQFIKQNAKFISFVNDSKISDTLDGLVIMKIDEMPENIMSTLKK